jgi:hypothetical protein
MMSRLNPFHFLEVTETAPPDEFVELFSDYLVQHAMALFQKGNVVIRGIEGSGKSMLLYLFKPEVRIAYDRAQKPFPVPSSLQPFISAGINFTKSGAAEFGQRRLALGHGDEDIPLLFADYFNHLVVVDLLQSLMKLDRELRSNRAELGIDSLCFDAFAAALARDACWFGSLRQVDSFASLIDALERRVQTYRAFMNFNIDHLPEDVLRTKTQIHEPIGQAVEHLWRAGVIPRHLNVFVRLDQFEEISTSRLEADSLGARGLRRILNKAFGMRDRRLFYRVGVRKYAWEQDLTIYGSSAVLEVERDYNQIDLDELLRRRENVGTWIFPAFAEEVFKARVRAAGFNVSRSSRILTMFFGEKEPANVRARKYARGAAYISRDAARTIDIDESWSAEWRGELLSLFEVDPLEARLGVAWIRQQLKQGRSVELSDIEGKTWKGRTWWHKERVSQALTQLAARGAQRMLWCGAKDVLGLSGGNVLVFLNICREVWAAYARTKASDQDGSALPRVQCNEQALGIYQVSVTWHDKIRSRPGGADRRLFVDALAARLRRRLLEDGDMSYPGHNGFSIAVTDIASDASVERFLRLASDYGDLFDYPHTTREKNRAPRRKWYVMPILSPYYQLPLTHTKEPWYIDTLTFRAWLVAAKVYSGTETPEVDADVNAELDQLRLFEGLE